MAAFLILIAAQAAGVAAPIPSDVRRFVERRRACDHWRGEDSPDAVRAREIDRAAMRACGGTDLQLDRLRRVHRSNPAAIAALEEFEHVER